MMDPDRAQDFDNTLHETEEATADDGSTGKRKVVILAVRGTTRLTAPDEHGQPQQTTTKPTIMLLLVLLHLYL